MSAARRDEVLAAVSYDEARTVSEIASIAYGRAAWDYRMTVRLRLLDLETDGLVICDENRPMRFMRPDPTLSGRPAQQQIGTLLARIIGGREIPQPGGRTGR
jgi:hypothetical protein